MDECESTTVFAALQDIPDPRCARGKQLEWSFILRVIATDLQPDTRTIDCERRGSIRTKEQSMKASRCTEAQIITILREAETGSMTIEAVCRKHAIAEATFSR